MKVTTSISEQKRAVLIQTPRSWTEPSTGSKSSDSKMSCTVPGNPNDG